MQMIVHRLLSFTAIGLVSGYLLVGREDWINHYMHITVVCIGLLLVAGYKVVRSATPHWRSWIESSALIAPVLGIGLWYWDQFNAVEARNLALQVGYAAVLCLAMISRSIVFVHVRDAVRCARCGYLLTGITSDRCPECGAENKQEQEYVALKTRPWPWWKNKR